MKTISGIERPNVHLQNDKGFTMAEMLTAFAVCCMIALFLPLGLRTVLTNQHSEIGLQRLEWEVFTSQIKKEVRLSSGITVQGDRLLLAKNGETVQFEKFGTNIRRRVSGTGHEIVLQNVASARFLPLPQGVIIQVTDLNGKQYEVTSRSFISLAQS
jgi:competence protein ComGF